MTKLSTNFSLKFLNFHLNFCSNSNIQVYNSYISKIFLLAILLFSATLTRESLNNCIFERLSFFLRIKENE